MPNLSKNIEVSDHDIPIDYADYIYETKVVAWDIETTGLDWRNDKIGTCQLYTQDGSVVIVKINDKIPKQLKLLLSESSIKKVFHHAMFDLRFMSHHWKLWPQNIACTKIASKLLEPKNENAHSLQTILKKYLGVIIEKGKKERTSNWTSTYLTAKQVNYATKDVIYLLSLLEVLERKLESKDLLEFARACFAHIPARVKLDILGYNDIYSY